MQQPQEYRAATDGKLILDLYAGNLVELLSEPFFQFVAPNTILQDERLQSIEEDLKKARSIHLWDFKYEELHWIQKLRQACPELEFNEVSSLCLAETLDIPLFTRSQPLSNAAERRGVTSIGLPWLIDILLQRIWFSENNSLTSSSFTKVLESPLLEREWQCS